MTDFSYQLYSSRNHPPLTETLKRLKALGYASVEGYGALYANDALVDQLKANLKSIGLTMPTGHFGLDMIEGDPGRVLDIARALDIETVYCPYIPAEQRPDSAAGYVDLGKRLQKAGAPLRDAGLGFGWHNHDFEFQKLPDGALPINALFEGGPDLEWEADLAWVVKGGADPLEWIKTFGKRLTAVHLKDIAPEGQNADEDGWADLGQGTIDWPALKGALANTNVKYFVIEHDKPSDDARFAERSLAAAQKL